MFTALAQPQFQGKNGRDFLWLADHNAVPRHPYLITGTLLGSQVVRVRALRDSQPDTARYALTVDGPDTLPYHSWTVIKGDEEWPEVADEAMTRTILEPYLQGFAFSPTHVRLSRPLASKESIYGLGERTGGMDKRGAAFPIWNIDPPQHHHPDTLTMYTSIPFYLGLHRSSGRAYGLFIDHTGRVEMDLGKTQTTEATMTVEGDSLTAYFFAGPSPADVLRQYSELTGRMPLPPLWALGHHQCRWSYKSAQELRTIATKLRAGYHPCDALWLDIDYMDGFRNFTWDPQRFPQPKQMLDDLHAQGLHLVTIIDPGTKIDNDYPVYQQGLAQDAFCRYANGQPFTGPVWPGACVFPDFSQSSVRQWWGNLYTDLLDTGVDAIWNDMNEPALTTFLSSTASSSSTELPPPPKTMNDDVLHQAGGDNKTGPDGPPVLHKFFHNAYGMEMARSTYEGLSRLRPSSRPFVLSRSGTAGIQRYAAKWTGDNTSRWEYILMAIPMCLNLSMSGVPFVGVDIGGFWEDTTGELLVRFAQLGALLPFCRNHSAMSTANQEPWAFGAPYESAYRTAIELRYRLLPYLYTLFAGASRHGAPIIRPLYYHYPQDEQACDIESAFLVGEHLLSAPIYREETTSRPVYLPGGTWFDYWTGATYPGGGESVIEAPLERWPLLVRDHSILPTSPLMQYTGERPTDPLTLTCYMATDGLASFTLYEDDGSSQAYISGEFALTDIHCRLAGDLATVEIEEHFTHFRPQRHEYELVIYAAGRTLQERIKAGQGKVTIHLRQ